MSESGSRQNLVKALRSLDAISIETKMREGVQDVNYVGGWIECKWRKSWPRDADTKPIRFEHPFMASQALRAEKRVRAGGTSLLCAQVGGEWFFFDGSKMRYKFGKMTRQEMHEECLLHMKRMDRDRLLTWLTQYSKG